MLNIILPLAFVGKAADTKNVFSNCHDAKVYFIFEFCNFFIALNGTCTLKKMFLIFTSFKS